MEDEPEKGKTEGRDVWQLLDEAMSGYEMEGEMRMGKWNETEIFPQPSSNGGRENRVYLLTHEEYILRPSEDA